MLATKSPERLARHVLFERLDGSLDLRSVGQVFDLQIGREHQSLDDERIDTMADVLEEQTETCNVLGASCEVSRP